MKQKDLMYLLLAAVILMAAGYLGFTQLAPKKAASATTEVEVIGLIPDKLDSDAVSAISDMNKVQDFNSAVDFSGLGNPAPFGQ